ncbi:MAG: hypothetical protein AABM43_04405 [Actinomycetota bacterium]
MRAAIRRALASPPPRGAVAVVVVGLLVTVAAVLLSRNPGQAGADVPYQTQTKFPESPPVAFGPGGNTQIVDGMISATAPNEVGDRLFTIETSLRAKAPAGAKIDSVRCQLRLPKGVHMGQSEGRRAAFPRPLANTADDAIKDGVPVDFTNGSEEQAGVTVRNVFFKYVVGGDPSVEWPNLNEGQHTWLWRYPKPVTRTRDNFAVILVARGGETVPLACTPEAKAGTVTQHATARTSVKLP